MHDMDHRLLAALRDCGGDPRVATVARGLSLAGEHGALWLVAGLAGAASDRRRRADWLRATALTAAAHLTSMAVKRVVRRPRPTLDPLVRTAGRHSFPSSHATSSAAATVAYGALGPVGALLVPPIAAAVCVSRLVVGVHYPSDVVAGAALGALTVRIGAAWMAGARTAAGAEVGAGTRTRAPTPCPTSPSPTGGTADG
ncbi:phosphatase PAP2 family protein [Streptomyces tsukubensis]|uniref:Phosphatase PAP2 family protein n=1 Tax=Streptomyces tsukubensis TaxID=83656 RepID=A0A1V4A2X4_9ACTN|nr:phosphatase PAP2 family protein [Streptomyces tsukubensis]QFR95359.1 phosphatase PAP2 family protein [Streptomyces tsukubensis]